MKEYVFGWLCKMNNRSLCQRSSGVGHLIYALPLECFRPNATSISMNCAGRINIRTRVNAICVGT